MWLGVALLLGLVGCGGDPAAQRYDELEVSILENSPSDFESGGAEFLTDTYWGESVRRGFETEPFRYNAITPPSQPYSGVVIYMHEAGGRREQGMRDDIYGGTFRRLKDHLQAKNWVYLTPDTTDYEQAGGQNLRRLAQHAQAKYRTDRVYLVGASAGGRTVLHAALLDAQSSDPVLTQVLALAPAWNSNIYVAPEPSTPQNLLVVQGTADRTISHRANSLITQRLIEAGHSVTTLEIPDGGHNTPLEQADWVTWLGSLDE